MHAYTYVFIHLYTIFWSSTGRCDESMYKHTQTQETHKAMDVYKMNTYIAVYICSIKFTALA